ncbi:MAG: sugar transferase [Cyanomargarita calcarea GSE-NOS-MK-12-04C]|jgi:exopolysaccharide biosynthesis polyprenyl glycosylphosphotransferase|uniref:Sugar transferase n=1 Tax=Cyanomargarita calcarea GSE-NOS-MK-12-04C TaxID=2839659 RepID=A0A951UWB5_9CYAN|nr:sugar transferase [Cyanomargarita calcarea GSE-NOS-MK-12-04C]
MFTQFSSEGSVSTKSLWSLRSIPVRLLAGDILGLIICLTFALWLRLGEPVNWFNPILYAFVLFVLAGLYLADTYKPDTQIAGLRAPARILLCSVVVGVTSAGLIYLSGAWRENPLLWRSVILPSLGLFTVWAIALRMMAVGWMRLDVQQSRWLILGCSETTSNFAQDFLASTPLGRLVVLTEDSQNCTQFTNTNLHCVGNISELSSWISQPWSGILVGSNVELSNAQVQQLMQMRLQGTPVYKLPDFYESLWYKLPSSLLHDTWFAFSAGFNLVQGRINSKLKRFVDIIAMTLLLVILSPLMLLAALAIKLDSPGPIFYSQIRNGLHGKPFRVYKFRSMYKDAEKRGIQWAQERDPRITRVGYWIRMLRIDELPQIWNVLRGEMSLIGPRPERPEFDLKLKEAIPYYEVRYLVKPGITGWAQVMYPYGASVEDSYEKLAYDLYYIKNYSLLLDIAIAFKTVRVVLLGKGR